ERAFAAHVPVRGHVKNRSEPEHAAGRQCQHERPPRGRGDAPASPAALLGREHQRVALPPRQVRLPHADARRGDQRDVGSRGNRGPVRQRPTRLLRATAWRTSALKADASTSSPSWMSIARRTFPSTLALKRRALSVRDAPLAKVSFTTLL